MQGTLDAILRRFVCVGRLTVRWPDGQRTSYAGPAGSGPSAGIVIADAGDSPPPGAQSEAGGRARPTWPAAEAGRMHPLRGHGGAGAERDGQRQGPSGRPRPQRPRRDAAPHRPVQPGASRAAQRGAPLRPERAAVQPVPRSRPAILLRLFPARRRDAGGGADRQEAAHRRQALPRSAGPDGAGHRLRLGRDGADPGARSWRAR